MAMFSFFKKLIFGNKEYRDLRFLTPIVSRVNALEPWALTLSQEDMTALTERWRKEVVEGKSLDALLPEAFAVAREAARRCLGERLYDVQLFGAIVLHQGGIMEMKTGEGKTLSSVPAAYLNSLTGHNLHMVTVNDYLAKRDSEWMRPVYEYLGVSVGAIQSSMAVEERTRIYQCDITYATNNELGFDYLRDNMSYGLSKKVQREHHFCIVDEIDSILIDEARTPLIISGRMESDTKRYYEVNDLVREFRVAPKDPETDEYPEEPDGDYTVDEKGRRVLFTNQGMNKLETLLASRRLISGSLFDQENFEYVHFTTQALRAHKLYRKDTEYVVRGGRVEIVDEFTGRILHGRRYSEGLHQAIEAKERIAVMQRSRTVATITLQNYFRMYSKISGMTGTAATEASEFAKIYNIDVVVIPTNLPLAREDELDSIYLTEKDKYNAIFREIETLHKKGQPILVGTISIEKSELLSKLLKRGGIRHEILNAKNHEREAHIIAEAGAKGAVTIATNMAGRGTDIKLGGNPEFRARSKKAGREHLDYRSIYEKELETWRSEYEEVRQLGGLCVIGTERHESRRIDNQLRGRSGRQGDPGRSKFFISMDDDLMRLFGRSSESIRNLMAKGLEPDEPLNHPLITKSLERAQKRVEERNFDIRKHLLEFDDVLNTQRSIIYEQRDSILADTALMKRALTTLSDVVDDPFSSYDASVDALKSACTLLEEQLLRKIPESIYENPEEAPTKLKEWYKASLKEKQAMIGAEKWNLVIRQEYLVQLDRHWQNHLDALDGLREAVYLRSYAQKNPLLEYKLEGFQIFDNMIASIRTSTMRRLLGLRIVTKDSQSGPRVTLDATRHSSAQLLGGGNTPRAQQQQPQGAAQTTVRRSIEKVGRNAPCPCGSGKKYKHCHGKA